MENTLYLPINEVYLAYSCRLGGGYVISYSALCMTDILFNTALSSKTYRRGLYVFLCVGLIKTMGFDAL